MQQNNSDALMPNISADIKSPVPSVYGRFIVPIRLSGLMQNDKHLVGMIMISAMLHMITSVVNVSAKRI